jgi:pimeloyl-ACP methyl ester carboxylesterase
MSTFVLVHGAFHGGWCWKFVAEELRRAGHAVFTPTLTGLGERRQSLGPAIDLEHWVADIIDVVECEELVDIVLVGHSFGGMVISGVADRLEDRIRHLVFLDAGIAESGRPVAEDLPAEVWALRVRDVVDVAGVPCFPPPPPSYFGVTDATLAAWLARRLTPMPTRVYETSIRLQNPVGNGLPATFVHCTRPELPVVARSAAKAKSVGWHYLEIATGHDAMLLEPVRVASILADAAVAGGNPHPG